jgi:alkylmercury lyase
MEDVSFDQIARGVANALRGSVVPGMPELSRQLLLLLSEGQPVSPERLSIILNISTEEVITALRQVSDIEMDQEGSVVGAFGLTMNETPNRFHVNDHDLFTWCALDALFLPSVLGQPARVESVCIVTGTRIVLTVQPDGVESLDPGDAVVVIAIPQDSTACSGVRGGFCDHVYYVSSAEAASGWLSENQKAIILPVNDAYKVGLMMLGYLFQEAPEKK